MRMAACLALILALALGDAKADSAFGVYLIWEASAQLGIPSEPGYDASVSTPAGSYMPSASPRSTDPLTGLGQSNWNQPSTSQVRSRADRVEIEGPQAGIPLLMPGREAIALSPPWEFAPTLLAPWVLSVEGEYSIIPGRQRRFEPRRQRGIEIGNAGAAMGWSLRAGLEVNLRETASGKEWHFRFDSRGDSALTARQYPPETDFATVEADLRLWTAACLSAALDSRRALLERE